MLRPCAIAMACGVASWLAVGAHAVTITLSQASSDATDPALLDATMDFTLPAGDTLSLAVANQSDYVINQIFFNGSDDVSSVTLTAVSDGSAWAASTGPQATKAGPFGTFDFAFSSDGNAEGIASGETVTFTFAIGGPCAATLTCDEADFVGPDTFSAPPPPTHLAQAAAKFVQGPGDDSAFGASTGDEFPPVVPEPAAGVLMGMGLAGLFLAGRRRRAG